MEDAYFYALATPLACKFVTNCEVVKWVFRLWARSFRLVWVPDKFEFELIRTKWWFCSTKWSSEVAPLGHFALRRLFFPQLRPHFDHRTGVDSKWSSDQLSFGGTKGHSGHFRRDLRRAQIWKLLKASQYFITKCNYKLVTYPRPIVIECHSAMYSRK